MNQNKVIRQPPSLLIEDTESSRSDMHTWLPARARNPMPTGPILSSRYFWFSVFVLFLGIAVFTWDTRKSQVRPKATSNHESVSPVSDVSAGAEYLSPPITLQQTRSSSLDSALIVNEEHLTSVSPGPEIPARPPRILVKSEVPDVTQPVKPHPQNPAPITPATARSSDAEVLIALLRYSEDSKSSKMLDLQDRLDECPAPNTRAGIRCRQNICAQPGGNAILCPEKAE